jgi:hypothetical protein
MMLELVYTSAPNTLDGPGYGVVAKSANLHERLETFMRQLNRYDFDLPVHAGETPSSPAVFSHTIYRDPSTTWHVLSRVAPGGCDYSQRAVYLAHHVALKPEDLRGTSIIEWIQEPSLFQSEWNGEVGVIPARETPSRARGRARRTAKTLGAGHLDWLKAWREVRNQPDAGARFLIMPEKANALELIAEGLTVFSPTEADEVTFITHLNADRPGVHFDWIGLAAGSELARSIASRMPDRTLDLTKPHVSVARSPARTERPPAALTRPKKPVHVPQSPGVPPREQQDFDSIWQSELRESHQPGPAPELELHADAPAARPLAPPPPPPPPPRHAFLRVGAPILALAVVIPAAIVGLGVLRKSGAQHTTDSNPQDATQAPSVQAKEDPSTNAAKPRVRDNEGLQARVPSEERSQHDQAQARGSSSIPGPESDKDGRKPQATPESTTASRQPELYHLKSWLWGTRSKSPDAQGWSEIEVEEHADPLIGALDTGTRPHLRLLPCEGLELIVKESPDAEVEVRLRSTQSSEEPVIKLRLKDRKLKVKGATSSDELFGALQLSILQIDPSLPIDAPLRIAFTPRMVPPIPLFHASDRGEIPRDADGFAKAIGSSDARGFFEAVDRESRNVMAHLRLDRVTLAICNNADKGWELTPNAAVKLEKDLDLVREVAVKNSGVRWSAPIKVSKHHKPADQGQPDDRAAIDAELIASPIDDGKKLKSQPSDKGNSSPTSAATSKKKPAKQGTSPQGKKSPEPKPDKATAKSKTETPGSPALVDLDRELLNRLFQRFGLVHGSIVINVKDGKSDKSIEIDLLEFGEPRKRSDLTPQGSERQ